MSLVVAFIGSRGAVIAGDTREIAFLGPPAAREELEAELYDGLIISDEHLYRRADELGVQINVNDAKSKISKRDGVIIGEVSQTEHGIVRKRRLYATAGSYIIAELEGPRMTIKSTGKASNFIVLGNPITQKIAHACIRDHWKNGTIRDAIRILILSLEMASRKTASVSKQFVIEQTESRVDISGILEKDTRESHLS